MELLASGIECTLSTDLEPVSHSLLGMGALLAELQAQGVSAKALLHGQAEIRAVQFAVDPEPDDGVPMESWTSVRS